MLKGLLFSIPRMPFSASHFILCHSNYLHSSGLTQTQTHLDGIASGVSGQPALVRPGPRKGEGAIIQHVDDILICRSTRETSGQNTHEALNFFGTHTYRVSQKKGKEFKVTG